MHAAYDGSLADYTALDEELFGDFSGHEDNITMTGQDPDILDSHEAATSGMSQVVVKNQAAATSRSKGDSQPHAFPITSGSPPTKDQHLMPLDAMDNDALSLGPIIPPFTTTSAPAITFANHNDSTQLITENISWVKARITDVHQLLLHYINLRNSHDDMATNLQKEIILRSETREALESIREQQDQTSEDNPRLQFQIALLKLDVQNERAARTAAETGIADINQKLCSYDELFSSMQARLYEFEEKEKNWQKEKELLTGRIEEELSDVTSGKPARNVSPELPSPL